MREEELHEVVIRAVNEALVTRDTFLPILKENIAMALNNNNGSAIAELDARLEELQKELIRKTDAQETYVTEYSEQMVRTLIEKITVYDNYFTVEFKSGMETNVQI